MLVGKEISTSYSISHNLLDSAIMQEGSNAEGSTELVITALKSSYKEERLKGLLPKLQVFAVFFLIVAYSPRGVHLSPQIYFIFQISLSFDK